MSRQTRPAVAGSVAEVDPAALRHNWRYFADYAAPGRIAAVVKADAYGLGLGLIVPLLSAAGCQFWYVATPDEGVALRALTGAGAHIGVLNGPTGCDLALFAANALTPVLNSLEQIALWKQANGGAAIIHVDTGMNRLGLPENTWEQARAEWPHPCLLMSHLACASIPSHALNARQCASFARARTVFGPAIKASFANTAGTQLGPSWRHDEIRVGIGLYGGGKPRAGQVCAAVRFCAPILQIRRLAKGWSTGYDASFVAARDMDVACVGAGYADGLLQADANRGYAVTGSLRRPILGRVSMDSTMVDVDGLDVRPGALVEFFGTCLGLGVQAEALGISEYALLTGLGPRVRRKLSSGGRP